MVASCANVTAGSTGAFLCDTLDGLGNGLGVFFAAIQDSLVEIVLVLGVIGAVVLLISRIGSGLGDTIGNAFRGTNRRR